MRKVYDANGDYFEPSMKNGLWSECVNWKDLLNDGYTHVLLHGKVYVMGKFGPLRKPVQVDE